MPDLSSYIDFRVTFDLTGAMPKLVLSDTGSYPGIVNQGLTGYFTITQPDTSVYAGSFITPDVEWDGSALTEKEHILALASDGRTQLGTYTILYSISHPDYTVTALSRTFVFNYEYPDLVLTKEFDVFTPSLSYVDETVYTQGGYTVQSLSRSWSAVMSEGTLTSNLSTFDLVSGGEYYDSEYEIDFESEFTYQHNTYTYLYVTDNLADSIETSAGTPPALEVLYDYLADLKDTLDSYINNDRLYNDYKRRYEYAATLLQTIKQSGCAGDVERLPPYLDEFIRVTNNYVTPAYTNTGLPIGAYDFQCTIGGGGGSGSSDISKLAVQIDTTSSSYTNASFLGKSLVLVMHEGLVLQDGAVTIGGSTASKTNPGDQFIEGHWYTFILQGATAGVTKLHVQMVSDSVTYTNAAFAGKLLLFTVNEGLIERDSDVSLSGNTVSKTQPGDMFFSGRWYTFILKDI